MAIDPPLTPAEIEAREIAKSLERSNDYFKAIHFPRKADTK